MPYVIQDKEICAVMKALNEWRPLLIGLQRAQFTILTDHRALEYFTTKRLLDQRQARWQETLGDYQFIITYRPGTENLVADVLSPKSEEFKSQKEKQEASCERTLLNAF